MTPSERAHYESETAQEGGGGLEGKVPDGPQGTSSADGADQGGEREIKEEESEEIPYEADLPPKQGVDQNLSERSRISLQKHRIGEAPFGGGVRQCASGELCEGAAQDALHHN